MKGVVGLESTTVMGRLQQALSPVEHTNHAAAMFSKRPTHIPFNCAALESSNYPPVILWLPSDHPLKCLKYLSLSGSVFSYNTVDAGGGVELVKVVVQSLHVSLKIRPFCGMTPLQPVLAGTCCVCTLMEG